MYVSGSALESYIWKSINQSDNLSQRNFFGALLLPRRSVVDLVMSLITRQNARKIAMDTQSVYICGCRGMGKSCTLALIGAELVKNGCTVYSFPILSDLSLDHVTQIFEAAKDESKTIAVLVDEIDAGYL